MEEKNSVQEDVKMKQPWYNTFWLWVWLVLFWPVGLYGLWKRVNPENRKWVAMGAAALFLFSIIGVEVDESGTSSSGTGSSYSSGESSYLEPNSLVCFSEKAFDHQMDLLVQGQERLVRGCTVIIEAKKISIDDYGMFGVSVVFDNSSGRRLWVSNESINTK